MKNLDVKQKIAILILKDEPMHAESVDDDDEIERILPDAKRYFIRPAFSPHLTIHHRVLPW